MVTSLSGSIERSGSQNQSAMSKELDAIVDEVRTGVRRRSRRSRRRGRGKWAVGGGREESREDEGNKKRERRQRVKGRRGS